MRNSLAILSLCGALAVMIGCREKEGREEVEAPPATPPADLSHGEAPVGTGGEPAPIDRQRRPARPPRSIACAS